MSSVERNIEVLQAIGSAFAGLPAPCEERAAIEAAIAALREQPEARGVVDDAMDVGAILTRYLPTKYWGLADHLAALAAAQQPGQEGGGECTKCRGTGEVCTGYIDGTPEMFDCTCPAAAPPSAPVGAKTLQQFMVEQEAKHPGIHDKVEAAADELRASLTQQPAQAAPGCTCPSGDGSLRWPCPTHPPGDDAAGGGHGR